jgi:asparagine synthase (glutamine-hydrolysing)
MCGIAGFVSHHRAACKEDARNIINRMMDVQIHRGPDGDGLWLGDSGPAIIGLGHKRLSIIDLSQGGDQPRTSSCGRYVLTYNGELYNYIELRAELQRLGCVFRTRSDTEVVLQALIAWGTGAFERFNGMWALAFLDTHRHVVVLSRDRFGEKPLYLYEATDRVFFSSEVKAVLAGSGQQFRVHLPAVARFVTQSLLDAQPESFFEGVAQVPAGHFVEVAYGKGRPSVGAAQSYWSLDESLPHLKQPELEEWVRDLFLDSVRLRLRSDVPVGVLLSGGIDSSAITAAVGAIAPERDVQVISAVSDDPRVSEEGFVDLMARHCGRSVHKIRLHADAAGAMDLISDATWHNDEPIGGFSSVAYYLMMSAAKDLGLKVILSGQGADESLCGYRKYMFFNLQQLCRDRQTGTLFSECASHLLPPWTMLRGFRAGDAKRYLPASMHIRPTILGEAFPEGSRMHELPVGLGVCGLRARQVSDLLKYSVPTLTHYEDRMSMAMSREVRLPFLDHRLVSLFVQLPMRYKIRRGWSKWLFRKALAPLLPREIAWRRDKNPFMTPAATWLRGAWREPIERIFSSPMVSASLGLVDQEAVRRMYSSYCRNTYGGWSSTDVFNPLALELWARRFKPYLN